MCCNRIIHDEISKEYDYINCPFCNKPINERKVKKTFYECCDNQDIINENGKIVYTNCGILFFYKYYKEYIDFNENKYKIRKNQFISENIMLIILLTKYLKIIRFN